jgi:hypothetical protein
VAVRVRGRGGRRGLRPAERSSCEGQAGAGTPVDTRFVHIMILTSSLLSGASSAT